VIVCRVCYASGRKDDFRAERSLEWPSRRMVDTGAGRMKSCGSRVGR
jgi:hypothetical protein